MYEYTYRYSYNSYSTRKTRKQDMERDQNREAKVQAWVDHKIETGGAIVHPAGTHMVGRKTTFQQRLDSCRDLNELEGFANRRQFNTALPRWTEDERAAIIMRRTEMQNVKRKRK